MEKQSVADFLARGGKVEVVPDNKKSGYDPMLKVCRCGCGGNYTDHTMRLGEKGIH